MSQLRFQDCVIGVHPICFFSLRTQSVLTDSRVWERKRKFTLVTTEISHIKNICKVKGDVRFSDSRLGIPVVQMIERAEQQKVFRASTSVRREDRAEEAVKRCDQRKSGR